MKSILRNLPLLCLVIFLFSCGDSQVASNENIVSSCDFLKDAKILKEEDRGETCVYLMIYSYKDEYYSLCECCNCDKAAVAVDCSGNQLCEDYSCMDDFLNKADYLFSVEQN